MTKFGISWVTVWLCILLNACSTVNFQAGNNNSSSTSQARKKNVEYNAVLTDPIIKKDFRDLAKTAINARVYKNEEKSYLAEPDIKKLNTLSKNLIDRLQNHYHIDPTQHKIHTFIGRNQLHSCFAYFDSIKNNIGKDCASFGQDKTSCDICDEFINKIHNRNQRIISFNWHKMDVTVLVDKLRLRNGDKVYLGLIITD